MALFEEKYGDRVRMVEIPGFSRELCGGTHTHKTGDIGLLVILQETSIAAGVRRIEALGGRHALEYLNRQRDILDRTAALLKTAPSEVAERVEKLWATRARWKKSWIRSRRPLQAGVSADLFEQAREVGGCPRLITRIDGRQSKVLREMNDKFKEKFQKVSPCSARSRATRFFCRGGLRRAELEATRRKSHKRDRQGSGREWRRKAGYGPRPGATGPKSSTTPWVLPNGWSWKSWGNKNAVKSEQ